MGRKYTEDIKEASTFSSRFSAREAIAELDGCPVGCVRHHMINTRGDGKFILVRIMDGMFFAGNIGNRYCSRLND